MTYRHLPLRPNVAIITFKDDKFLIVNCTSRKNEWWKFPQGGIDPGEDVIQAGVREFKEELGTDKVKVHGVSQHSNAYEWPSWVIQDANLQFRGQHQQFIVVEFLGEDHDIKINEREIAGHRWVTKEDLLHFQDSDEQPWYEHYYSKVREILDEFDHIIPSRDE